MNATLLINGHRNPDISRYGKALFQKAMNLPGVSPHILMQQYPDFRIDGAKERELVLKHQNIVLQFPFYWYSSPAIVKEWLDEVLARGWAYGTGGSALAGKKLMLAITTGGPEEAYQYGGANKFPIGDLLRPFDQMANLCGMKWEQPFVMYGVMYLNEGQIADICSAYVKRIIEL